MGYGPLHTLAALYAEHGDVALAYEALHATLAKTSARHVSSADWMLLGRMAELLELPQVAKESYARVQAPQVEEDDSVHRYAQERLKRLKSVR